MSVKWKRKSGGFAQIPAGNDKSPRLEDLFEVLAWPKKAKWVQIRLFGPIVSSAQHWFKFSNAEGKEVNFPKDCLRWDSEEHGFDISKPCPYCDLADKFGGKVVRAGKFFYSNAIVRDLQEDTPSKIKMTPEEKKSGFKNMESDSWTPVRVVKIPISLARKLKSLAELNKAKIDGQLQVVDLSDYEHGCDVQVKYDAKVENPTDMYQVQKDERTPITEDEEGYLVFNIEEPLPKEELASAKEEAKRIAKSLSDLESDEEEEDEEEEDEEEEAPRSKKSSKASKTPEKKGKKPPVDDDEEEEEEEEEEEDEEEEEEEDEDDEDEEEEETPRSKKSSKKPAAKPSKKKPPVDDDEEEEDDEDEEEEDDEEETPRSKKSSKASKTPEKKGKKSTVNWDDV